MMMTQNTTASCEHCPLSCPDLPNLEMICPKITATRGVVRELTYAKNVAR